MLTVENITCEHISERRIEQTGARCSVEGVWIANVSTHKSGAIFAVDDNGASYDAEYSIQVEKIITEPLSDSCSAWKVAELSADITNFTHFSILWIAVCTIGGVAGSSKGVIVATNYGISTRIHSAIVRKRVLVNVPGKGAATSDVE